LYIFFYIGLLLFSIFLHGLFFGLIQLGLLGTNLKIILNYLLDKNINLICIFSFVGFILLKFYLGFNEIYLDSPEIVVKATIDDLKFELTGDVLQHFLENVGSVGVFVAGSRIAATLLANHPMGLLPISPVIGDFGAGLTITYRIVIDSMQHSYSSASISAKPVKITLEKVVSDNTPVSGQEISKLVLKNFGIDSSKNYPSFNLNYSDKIIDGKRYLTSMADENSSRIIASLEENNPNWRDSFIHSPLEENQLQFIINTLSNNLLLNFIILYLLIMLLLIISCKFLVKDNIEFKSIKNYRLGKALSYIINKYISIWKVSSNIWIYFILLSLIFFKLVSTYSIYTLLLVFQ
jgi:hypothetical protein